MRFYLIPVVAALVVSFWGLPSALGQPRDPRGPALSALYGPHLADEVPGVDEVMPLSGLRFGHRFLRSQIEYGALMANSHNIRYERFHVTFRNPVGGGPIIAHWLFGLHLDHYTPRPSGPEEAKWASGWHLGAGWRGALTEDLSFRNDYIWGKSPGSQLHIQVGLEYFFSFSSSP